MSLNTKAPSCFISHGAPTFAIEQDALSDFLSALGKTLHDVRAVLIVSPHWQTQALEVMSNPAPQTIHDFYGFPAELNAIQYPAPGSPNLAKKTITLLSEHGLIAKENSTIGLDHGAWTPLVHLFPEHQTPVFQVSLPRDYDAQAALNLGKALAALRDEGVMIIGSGGLTHNLYELHARNAQPEIYIQEFINWMDKAITENQQEALANYRKLAPHSQRAHPTDEHLLPLFVAIGARNHDEQTVTVENAIYFGTLSTQSYFWGIPNPQAL